MKKYFITFIFTIVTILLSACSADNKMPESDSAHRNAYERTEYPFIKEHPDSTIHVVDSSRQKCLYYESMFEEIDGKPTFVVKDLYEFDYASGKCSKLDYLSEKEKYNGYHYLPDDELISIDEESNIFLLNKQREVVASNNLNELSFPDCDLESCVIYSNRELESDGKYIYISGLNRASQGIVLVLDYNLKEKAVFFSEKGWWKLVNMSDNKIRLVDDEDNQLFKYDDISNSLVDDGKTAANVFRNHTTDGVLQGNDEYDFFYYTKGRTIKESGLREDVLVGVKDGKQEIVFDYAAMGIEDFYIERITSDQQNGFWVWGESLDQRMVLYHYALCDTAQDYSAKANKKICKIGCLFLSDGKTQGAIKRFNQLSEDYYFETVEYQKIYKDRDISIMHMFLDCQNGTLDGLILDNIEEEFVKTDVLMDLEEYFQQSHVVSKDMFISHYLESITDSDGKLYALYPSFRAFGYAYEEAIDFSNLSQYEELCEEGRPFLSSWGEEDDLAYLLRYSGDKYIDEKNGKIHVQEESFRSMLQFIKKIGSCKAEMIDPVMQYCEGKSLATRVTISEPCGYLYFNELFHKNVVITNVGTDGPVISERKGMVGICQKTENKDAFYSFFDYLYEPTHYHEKYFVGSEMPVLKDEYNLWKDYFLATEAYVDKYGKHNPKHDFQIGMGAAECIIKIGSISEQEALDAVTVIQEVRYIKPMRAAYIQIIVEEAMAYFAGDHSLDEVCENMENRLVNAMEENM